MRDALDTTVKAVVKPKCIVQGLGVVLNHAKEGALHWDLRSGERSL